MKASLINETPFIINIVALQRKMKASLMNDNSFVECGFPLATNDNPFVELGVSLATNTKLHSSIVIEIDTQMH
jgi:hypothetical protein